MSANSPVMVRVTHRFAAPADAVFDAWLDVELLGRWMFGPAVRDEEIVRLSADPRVGFTWGLAASPANPSVVAIDLVSVASGCELTLVHELHPDWADYADRTRAGWTTMVTALAAMIDG